MWFQLGHAAFLPCQRKSTWGHVRGLKADRQLIQNLTITVSLLLVFPFHKPFSSGCSCHYCKGGLLAGADDVEKARWKNLIEDYKQYTLCFLH